MVIVFNDDDALSLDFLEESVGAVADTSGTGLLLDVVVTFTFTFTFALFSLDDYFLCVISLVVFGKNSDGICC